MTTERIASKLTGWGMLAFWILVVLASAAGLVFSIMATAAGQVATGVTGIIVSALVMATGIVCFNGLFVLEPNEGMVLILFGRYKGTVKDPGFWWANPLNTKKKVSLRVRNFDSEKLKVNDKKGNPIMISAVVVWRVTDTAQATFDVDDYMKYVHVQAESAIRRVATHYPYDDMEGEAVSLRSSIDEVSEALGNEIQERVLPAGVVIDEARINHLAYAPEIAHAMLQRQQAEAIIAARQKIVDGAVGMVEMALNKLRQHEIIELDEERKAAMVSNLLVVLCGEHATQPIINTGTLY